MNDKFRARTRRLSRIAVAGVLLSSIGVVHAGEFVDMLSDNLEHWRPLGDANWKLGDGVLAADGGKGFLVSKQAYGNFEMTLEFHPAVDSNSGVFMRCADPKDINDKGCYEANIFDKRPDQSGRTGGIPNYAPPTAVIDSEGQWNTYEITMSGSQITVKLNGETTVDARDSTHASGPVALQYAAGRIEFRNVKIRSLD